MLSWVVLLVALVLLPVQGLALSLVGSGGGGISEIRDEGTAQGGARVINCAGDGIACAITDGVLELSVSGVGGDGLEDPGGNGLVHRTGLGVTSPYAGTSCTNQVLRVLSAAGAGTCITLTSAYVDSSIALTGGHLGQFAATTSAQLAGVLSNETGTGLLVFATSPVLTTPDLGTPPVLTGSSAVLAFSQTQSSSGSVTVPADADIAICTAVGYHGSAAGNFSGGTVTLGGSAMTAVTGGDASTAAMQGALFYRVAPATGAQTLAWTWVVSPSDPGRWYCHFYADVNTADAVRSTSCTQQGDPHVTGSLTVVSGDTAAGWVWNFVGGESTFTFNTGGSNLTMTERVEYATGNATDLCLADATPSGNGTISAALTTGANTDGGICGIVLKPAP